jgi:hypothetical protein
MNPPLSGSARTQNDLTADCADIADESQWESLSFIRVIREIRG